MREPQVDTFCRCVKKVKKTLKAEGRAIAVCTKSVLQTKGRTLRKVRCRDHLLETQPLKQKGGVFRWAGADTPVFDETKLENWNGFPIPAEESKAGKWLDDRIALWQPVVRMVSSGDGEIPIHRALKNMFNEKTDAPFDDFVKMHINLWAGDGIYRVDYDKTRAMVATQPPMDGKLAKLDAINARFTRAAGGQLKWYGLITRRQLVDVADMLIIPRIRALCTILRVLLHIDGRVVHFDLHARNMASMQDDTPVIHDVGRMRFRDILASYAPWEIIRPMKNNKRILRNVLMPIFQWPNYNMEYRQYFYIARFFKGLRKSWGETFQPPVAPDYKYVDVEPTGESKGKFNEWLNASSGPMGDILPRRKRSVGWIQAFAKKGEEMMDVYDEKGTVVDIKSPTGALIYLDPPYETRYHQIARVFDILSVLAALSNTSGEGNMAYFYARKTAVKILGLLRANPPAATKANVGATIRAYLETTGTQMQFGGNNPEKEKAHATAYLGAVNSARSGKTTDPPALQEANKAAYEAHKKAAQAQYDVNVMKAKAAAARNAAAEAERAADAALVAAVAARAAAPAEAVEDVGAPDPQAALNDAVNYSKPELEAALADLNAIPVPKQMALDEAVVDASEILRKSEEEDNSKELIKHGLILSVDDVIAEANAEGPGEIGKDATDNGEAPPKIKRMRDPILFAEGPAAAAKEEPLDEAAELAEPLTGVTYVNDSSGNLEVGSAPAGSAAAQPMPSGGRLQRGGEFINAGACTVVIEYFPPKATKVGDSYRLEPYHRKDVDEKLYVCRLVNKSSPEPGINETLREFLRDKPSLSQVFNLAVDIYNVSPMLFVGIEHTTIAGRLLQEKYGLPPKFEVYNVADNKTKAKFVIYPKDVPEVSAGIKATKGIPLEEIWTLMRTDAPCGPGPIDMRDEIDTSSGLDPTPIPCMVTPRVDSFFVGTTADERVGFYDTLANACLTMGSLKMGHGDIHGGNVMRSGDKPVFIDYGTMWSDVGGFEKYLKEVAPSLIIRARVAEALGIYNVGIEPFYTAALADPKRLERLARVYDLVSVLRLAYYDAPNVGDTHERTAYARLQALKLYIENGGSSPEAILGEKPVLPQVFSEDENKAKNAKTIYIAKSAPAAVLKMEGLNAFTDEARAASAPAKTKFLESINVSSRTIVAARPAKSINMQFRKPPSVTSSAAAAAGEFGRLPPASAGRRTFRRRGLPRLY